VELFALCPASQLEDHPLSAVRDCFSGYWKLLSISRAWGGVVVKALRY
jgi:hypothetical protein